MADNGLADLIQKVAFYGAGGQDPGNRGIDKINNIFSTIQDAGDQYTKVIRDVLANKKAQIEQERVGKSFNIPTAEEEAKQRAAYQANPANAPAVAGTQSQPGADNSTILNGPGIAGTQPIGTDNSIVLKAQPAPKPFVSKRDAFSSSHEGLSSDTSMLNVPEALKVAALTEEKQMYVNDKGQISFDAADQLKGYRPFAKVPEARAAGIAATAANATRPMPVITEADALSNTAAGNAPTKNTRIVQGNTIALNNRAAKIGDAMIAHIIPPDVTKLAGGRGGLGGAVLEYLASKGFDYKSENLKWQQSLAGAVSLSKSLNSTQMVQLQTSFNTIANEIQPMRDISNDVERTGFNPANKLIINARMNGVEFAPGALSGLDNGQVAAATKYITQINLMRDNMATAFVRGGVPTDQAFKLTEQILNPAYSNPQLNSALDQVENNLQYREQALHDVTVASPGKQLQGGNTNINAIQSQLPRGAKIKSITRVSD